MSGLTNQSAEQVKTRSGRARIGGAVAIPEPLLAYPGRRCQCFKFGHQYRWDRKPTGLGGSHGGSTLSCKGRQCYLWQNENKGEQRDFKNEDSQPPPLHREVFTCRHSLSNPIAMVNSPVQHSCRVMLKNPKRWVALRWSFYEVAMYWSGWAETLSVIMRQKWYFINTVNPLP